MEAAYIQGRDYMCDVFLLCVVLQTSAAQKALWDKNQDPGLRPYTPNDPALVSSKYPLS